MKSLILDASHERDRTNLKYYEQYLKHQRAQSGALMGDTGSLEEAHRSQRDSTNADATNTDSSTQQQIQVPDMEVYEALCRGPDTSDPAMARFKSLLADLHTQQYCFLMRTGHPVLLIAPARVEQMLADPRVLLFHDMIYPREMDTIKQSATPYVLYYSFHLMLKWSSYEY